MPRAFTKRLIEVMTKRQKYHGTVVPMVTPLMASGILDEAALHRIVDKQAAGGVEGIFVLGTTGEGAHVPPETRRKLVAETVKHVNRRMVVFAGLGDIRSVDVSERTRRFPIKWPHTIYEIGFKSCWTALKARWCFTTCR
jgi:hypothetical protein